MKKNVCHENYNIKSCVKNNESLDNRKFENLRSILQSRTFRITLNPDEEYQKTAIQDCFTIFLNNYSLLKEGVLQSKYKWQTGLLYAHVCPFLCEHGLVNKINHPSYGFIYKISDTGVAFYEMINIKTSNY